MTPLKMIIWHFAIFLRLCSFGYVLWDMFRLGSVYAPVKFRQIFYIFVSFMIPKDPRRSNSSGVWWQWSGGPVWVVIFVAVVFEGGGPTWVVFGAVVRARKARLTSG